MNNVVIKCPQCGQKQVFYDFSCFGQTCENCNIILVRALFIEERKEKLEKNDS